MSSKLQKSTEVYKDTDCNFPSFLQKALLYINFHSKTVKNWNLEEKLNAQYLRQEGIWLLIGKHFNTIYYTLEFGLKEIQGSMIQTFEIEARNTKCYLKEK